MNTNDSDEILLELNTSEMYYCNKLPKQGWYIHNIDTTIDDVIVLIDLFKNNNKNNIGRGVVIAIYLCIMKIY